MKKTAYLAVHGLLHYYYNRGADVQPSSYLFFYFSIVFEKKKEILCTFSFCAAKKKKYQK